MPPPSDSNTKISLEGLAVRRLDELNQPIDSRATTSDVQPSHKLDETISEQISDVLHPRKEKKGSSVTASVVEATDEPLYVRHILLVISDRRE